MCFALFLLLIGSRDCNAQEAGASSPGTGTGLVNPQDPNQKDLDLSGLVPADGSPPEGAGPPAVSPPPGGLTPPPGGLSPPPGSPSPGGVSPPPSEPASPPSGGVSPPPKEEGQPDEAGTPDEAGSPDESGPPEKTETTESPPAPPPTEPPDPCTGVVCENGGTCEVAEGEEPYCECVAGWVGPFCGEGELCFAYMGSLASGKRLSTWGLSK